MQQGEYGLLHLFDPLHAIYAEKMSFGEIIVFYRSGHFMVNLQPVRNGLFLIILALDNIAAAMGTEQ